MELSNPRFKARYVVVDADTEVPLRPSHFSNLVAAFGWGDRATQDREDKDFKVIDYMTGEVIKRSVAIDESEKNAIKRSQAINDLKTGS